MKQLTVILITLAVIVTSNVNAQERRSLRAAELSFSAAENDYKRGKHLDAAQKFTIVVNNVPAAIDSRKHLELRLESLIKLVDIYFYKHINLSQACEYLEEYSNTMNTVRHSGVLKGTGLLKYLKQEQNYANKEVKQCSNYENVGKDMDKFRKTFEKEFE